MFFETFAMVFKRPSVLFRSDDEDDDEEGAGLCEQQEQPTLRKSTYVKQIGKF